ncbi:MAG: histidine kinase [Burkholderiales bacterium]
MLRHRRDTRGKSRHRSSLGRSTAPCCTDHGPVASPADQDERARLARELHDELGALLTAAKVPGKIERTSEKATLPA